MPHGGTMPLTDEQMRDHEKAQTLVELQAVVRSKINEVLTYPPSPEREELLARLQGALNGNVTGINALLADVPSARDDVLANSYDFNETQNYTAATKLASGHVSDYGEYSEQGQRFINNQVAFARKNSEEFRQASNAFEALPSAEREIASEEQKRAQGLISNYLHGQDKDRYAEYHESLRIFRSTGLANGPGSEKLLEQIRENHPERMSPEVFREIIDQKVAVAAAKNEKFVNEDMLPKLPESARAALKQEFDRDGDGKLDVASLMKESAKIRTARKDTAYQALAANNGDVSKLSAEDQRIVHMGMLTAALETKTSIEGALAIVGRNQDIAKQLTDPKLSIEARESLLRDEMGRQGIPQNAYTKAGLHEAMLAIDETVREGNAYDPNKSGEFLKKVGENVKENYDEMMRRKGADGQFMADNEYSYNKFAYFTAVVKSGEEVPEWAKKNGEYAKSYEDSAATWQKIQEQYKTAFGYGYAEPEQARTQIASAMDSAMAQVARDGVNLGNHGVKGDGKTVAGDPPVPTIAAIQPDHGPSRV